MKPFRRIKRIDSHVLFAALPIIYTYFQKKKHII